MKSFLIPISGLIATSLTVSSVSFAESKGEKESPQKEKSTEIYSGFGLKVKQSENLNEGEGQNTKTTITQTTKIVKERRPKSWWEKMLSPKLLIACVVGYSLFAGTSFGIAAETIGISKMGTNWLGIEKKISEILTISFGIVGAFAVGLEGLYHIING